MIKRNKAKLLSGDSMQSHTRQPSTLFAIALASSIALSGCNLFDSDKKELSEEINVPPTTITVDLITQTETAITDRLSASDENGDMLTFSLSQEASLGVVTVDMNGEFTYQPNAEVTGSDYFSYSVSDGVNPAVEGRVNITIEALEVSFSSASRAAFNQQPNDRALSVNGRVFIQDVEDPAAYDDLLGQ